MLTIRQFRLDMANNSRKLFRNVVCRTNIKSIYPSHRWQYFEKPFGERGHAHEIFTPFTIKNLPFIVLTKSCPIASWFAVSMGFFIHSTWISIWILFVSCGVSHFTWLLFIVDRVSVDGSNCSCLLLLSLHLSLKVSVVFFCITATGWLVCCVVVCVVTGVVVCLTSDGVQMRQFSRHAGPLRGSFVDVGSINNEISPSYPRFRSNFLKPAPSK